jgi:hypothetical protein
VTTPLLRPLSREILVCGTAYRVTVAADRLTLTPKGRRKGVVELTWDELLNWRERDEAAPPAPVPTPSGGAPRAIIGELAREIRAAASALTRAEETVTKAGVLPPELRAELAGDPRYGLPEQRADWFIEPLLTDREVASLLRLSTRAVRRLPIRSIILAGEIRYRQSEIRAYLQKQESTVRSW